MKFTPEQQIEAWELYTHGKKISAISRILNLPYPDTWVLTKGRELGATNYRDYRAQQTINPETRKPFENRTEQQIYLARQKGFRNLSEYNLSLARKRGFKSSRESQFHTLKKRNFNTWSEYLNHLARKKGFRNFYEYKQYRAGKNRTYTFNIDPTELEVDSALTQFIEQNHVSCEAETNENSLAQFLGFSSYEVYSRDTIEGIVSEPYREYLENQ